MNDDERAIRNLIATGMDATQAGDIDTVLSLMTDDVVFMVPGHEPFGREAFAAASREMQGTRLQGTSEIRELKVVGNWAYLRGYLQVAMTSPAGNTFRRSGYTLTILRKEPDGRWRLARDANLLTPQESVCLIARESGSALLAPLLAATAPAPQRCPRPRAHRADGRARCRATWRGTSGSRWPSHAGRRTRDGRGTASAGRRWPGSPVPGAS